jgi:uncharacterized RDD family membrane protein YckC
MHPCPQPPQSSSPNGSDEYPPVLQSGQWLPAARPSLADPGLRFAARILDTLFTFGCTLVFGLVITGIFAAIHQGDMDQAGVEYGIPMLVVLLGTPFIYEWTQVAKWGGTAGKQIIGIRVVRASDAGPVSARRAAVRALCYSPGIYYVPNFVPVLAQLNVLWMLWDKPLRQCLHDKAAETIVVTR